MPLKKPAQQKRKVAAVRDIGPTKDAKGGGQKKETPASPTGILSN